MVMAGREDEELCLSATSEGEAKAPPAKVKAEAMRAPFIMMVMLLCNERLDEYWAVIVVTKRNLREKSGCGVRLERVRDL